MIDSCDAYLRDGRRSVDLLELRGLARAKRNDFAGAIDDFTLAIALQPKASGLRNRRGWAYLVSGAAQLSLRDFEEAIRLDSSSGDAYSGRGSASVVLGHFQEAAADAQESLRHGEPDARMLYNAARILTQAAETAAKNTTRDARPDTGLSQRYRDHAIKLLGEALERTAPRERRTFWHEVIRSDKALNSIRNVPEYKRWAAEYAAMAR